MENKKAKVLLLEPHPTAARMLCTMLAGFEELELVRVRSLKEAESLSRCWDFDILMGFLGWEEEDCLANCFQLKKIAGKKPLVVLSGAASKERSDFAVQFGASAVMERSSLNPSSVLKMIHRFSDAPAQETLAAA